MTKFIIHHKEILKKDRLKEEKMDLIKIYNNMKEIVLKEGYQHEIEWVKNIPKEPSKEVFFTEYVWVVCSSGMKNSIARKIFNNFCNNEDLNFQAIKHPHKKKAIKQVFKRLDFYYEHFKKSKNKLMFLKNLPHIGDITKYHLARNLGINVAKPDRHLKRISNLFDFNNVQDFCNEISQSTDDSIATIDLIIWRYATLVPNYLEILKNRNKNNKKE